MSQDRSEGKQSRGKGNTPIWQREYVQRPQECGVWHINQQDRSSVARTEQVKGGNCKEIQDRRDNPKGNVSQMASQV